MPSIPIFRYKHSRTGQRENLNFRELQRWTSGSYKDKLTVYWESLDLGWSFRVVLPWDHLGMAADLSLDAYLSWRKFLERDTAVGVPQRYRNESLKSFFFSVLFIYFTLYWFCHTSTQIHQGCTCVPHPEPASHLPPHTIPLGHPSAPALSILYPASKLDWRLISHMIIYMFQCHSPISSCPPHLPQSPKDCSIHLCLFCCLAYRVIIMIFLNSIYMH